MNSQHITVKVRYLYHSGYAVSFGDYQFIFDYFAKPGSNFDGSFENGHVNSAELTAPHIYVFSSHKHPDHFDKRILNWGRYNSNITYILSDDIPVSIDDIKNQIHKVHFNQEYFIDDLHITTYHSTDCGVAFLIQAPGITLYHGGDLNWWHWKGDSKQNNDTMAGQYKHEIDLMKGIPIDIAFLPLDPRQEEAYALGAHYFMKALTPSHVFPMHFAEQYEVFDWMKQDPRMELYLEQIQIISHMGEEFELYL